MSRHKEFVADLEASLREYPAMLSTDQVAEVVGVSSRTVRTWLASGEIKAVKLSQGRTGRVRVPRAALVAFLAERVAI